MKKIILLAVLLIVAFGASGVQAQSCPVDDDWIMYWRTNDLELTYKAPPRMMVAETCQQEGNEVFYSTITPNPRKHVTIQSITGGEIHYASFRIVNAGRSWK